MTQMIDQLTASLAPRHAIEITDVDVLASVTRTMLADDYDEGTYLLRSDHVTVLAGSVEGRSYVIAFGEDTPVPRAYGFTTETTNDIAADCNRLFLAKSVELEAFSRFAGWRDRVVAAVPEENGFLVMWTLDGGGIDGESHQLVPTMMASYMAKVNQLAMEVVDPTDPISLVVQSWLMREAASAQLDHARRALRVSLGMTAPILKARNAPISVSELARSLYTDRANLTRVIQAASKTDPDERLGHASIQAVADVYGRDS